MGLCLLLKIVFPLMRGREGYRKTTGRPQEDYGVRVILFFGACTSPDVSRGHDCHRQSRVRWAKTGICPSLCAQEWPVFLAFGMVVLDRSVWLKSIGDQWEPSFGVPFKSCGIRMEPGGRALLIHGCIKVVPGLKWPPICEVLELKCPQSALVHPRCFSKVSVGATPCGAFLEELRFH